MVKLTKNKKIAIVAASVIVGIIIFVAVRRNGNAKKVKEISDILDGKKQDPNSGGGQNIIPKSEYDKLPAGTYPIKFGQKNKKVYEIQKLLNKKFGSNIDLDGRYGETTWKAMCDKIWSSWIKAGECYELSKTSPSASNPTGLVKRYLTNADYESLK